MEEEDEEEEDGEGGGGRGGGGEKEDGKPVFDKLLVGEHGEASESVADADVTRVRLVQQVVDRNLDVAHLALELVADFLEDEEQAGVVGQRPVIDILSQLVERLWHLRGGEDVAMSLEDERFFRPSTLPYTNGWGEEED